MKRKKKVASWRAGIEWIALNDEPTDTNPDTISAYISTMLMADLFGVSVWIVTNDILSVRLAEKYRHI